MNLSWNLYMFLHWSLCKVAHENRIRVLMDVLAATSLVSTDWLRLIELARAGKWGALLSRPWPVKTPPPLAVEECFGNGCWVLWRRRRFERVAKKSGTEDRRDPGWARIQAFVLTSLSRVGIRERFQIARRASRANQSAREDHWRELTCGAVSLLASKYFDRGPGIPYRTPLSFF